MGCEAYERQDYRQAIRLYTESLALLQRDAKGRPPSARGAHCLAVCYTVRPAHIAPHPPTPSLPYVLSMHKKQRYEGCVAAVTVPLCAGQGLLSAC